MKRLRALFAWAWLRLLAVMRAVVGAARPDVGLVMPPAYPERRPPMLPRLKQIAVTHTARRCVTRRSVSVRLTRRVPALLRRGR